MTNAAIIIPHFNDEERLRLLLESINGQLAERKLHWSVIVVDDRSADPGKVENVCTALGARFLRGTGGGSYSARNLGIAAAGDVIGVFFTDSDCVAGADVLATYESWLLGDDHRYVAAGPIELFPELSDAPTRWEVLDMATGLPQKKNVEKGVAVTANACVRAQAFSRFGVFNESFRSGGDIEFTQKVAVATGGIAWLPQARILHPARHTRDEHFKKLRRIHKGIIERELADPGRSHWQVFGNHFWRSLRPPLGAWKLMLSLPRVGIMPKLGGCLAILEVKAIRTGITLRYLFGQSAITRSTSAEMKDQQGLA